jgi:hypothetical protein
MSPLSAEMRSRSETGFLVGVAKCSESYVKQSSFRRSSVRSGSMILGRIVGLSRKLPHIGLNMPFVPANTYLEV